MSNETEAVTELVAAIRAVVDAWDGGDLAGAVNNARQVADIYDTAPVKDDADDYFDEAITDDEDDGTSGQDRKTYSDDQDRETYTVDDAWEDLRAVEQGEKPSGSVIVPITGPASLLTPGPDKSDTYVCRLVGEHNATTRHTPAECPVNR